MAVKLELYRVFKEVAETGNISAAAKNLYISQSAVSQSIKQLETALQARLFATHRLWKAAESGGLRTSKIFSVSKKPFLPAELVFRTFIKVLKT